MMVGGYSDVKQPDEEITSLIASLDADIQNNLQQFLEEEASTIEVIHYKCQVVAGMNYQVKLKVNENLYAHVAIFRPLPHTGESPRLMGVETGKTLEDQL
mmetsp:Transcript_7055/g.8767  ORF Transcript_7055/g.8767 Transcript_7055/m.8767 type:complete len:100 (+) Transcript_7055:115-414(+)